MRIHLNQKICRNMMMLLTIWLMSIQTLWAQSLSFRDLKETCDFQKEPSPIPFLQKYFRD